MAMRRSEASAMHRLAVAQRHPAAHDPVEDPDAGEYGAERHGDQRATETRARADGAGTAGERHGQQG